MHERIAVLSMSGRFPQAPDVDALWNNLCAAREGISFFTEDELRAAGCAETDLANPQYVRAAGALSDIDLFDAGFFGCSPREAELLDPQHRLLLECAWEALEAAGYTGDHAPRRIAVFAGCFMSRYLLALLGAKTVAPGLEWTQSLVANDKDFLPTRLSYKLNLTGPSIAVQTACSSSLVAVHLACQSLRAGDCDAALAGGASIRTLGTAGYLHVEGGIGSSDGHCRAFDAAADGTVGGDGVAVVLLKRLSDAVRDGDTIRAVIRGSALNNDGALKVGYMAPSVDGQAAVIVSALRAADVEPESIGYVEAHGTGTMLGDPIEIAALTKAYRQFTARKQFCALGSIKTNIGHLDVAAGATGLIKTVLALQHRRVPASLHFTAPNPKIDFANSPFFVNASLADWSGPLPRRAGVSSFGIGGTNAHVVVEEAPTPDAAQPGRPFQLLTLSARSPAALDAMTARLADHLKHTPDADIADVAYTLQIGRKAFAHRRMCVGRTAADAIAVLDGSAGDRLVTAAKPASRRSVAFMFPGQGTQLPRMMAALYDGEPRLRQDVDQCAELLLPLLDLDIRDVVCGGAPTDDARIHRTAITQPALFVMEYALARLWIAWGVRPDAMIGHSIGEYVAACLAGVFTLGDALKVIAARGRLMDALPGGAMAAVFASERDLAPLLNDRLAIAAINGAELCVIAGPTDAIAAFEADAEARDLETRRLRTSHAFHSAMMEPALPDFARVLDTVTLNRPRIPFVSNVTGGWITGEQATDRGYWVSHLRRTVRFADGLKVLFEQPNRVLVEVGPGRSLATAAARHAARADQHVVVSSLPDVHGTSDDVGALLAALGRVWLTGASVDWPSFSAHERRRRVPLPTYPFERQRYWCLPVPPPTSADRRGTPPPSPAVPAPPHSDPRERDGVGAGPAPLTPIQRWFFEREIPERHHWNMSVLLEVRPQVTPAILQHACDVIVERHDALRLRFARGGSSWRQIVAAHGSFPLTVADVTALAGDGRARAIADETARAQRSLSLESGPLARAVLFADRHAASHELLVVCHHLAIDVLSWQILAHDLELACRQLLEGRAVDLPPKTTSFRTWSTLLAEHARSAVVRDEASFWLAQSPGDDGRVGVKYAPNENTIGSSRTFVTSLTAEQTHALARTVARAHRAQLSDAVLAAVARALTDWSAASAVTIALESHGRDAVVPDVDVSGTIGWFTSIFPLRIDVNPNVDSVDAVGPVRALVQRAGGGISYGLLRYLSDDASVRERLNAVPQPEISFNFTGRHRDIAPPGSLFRTIPRRANHDRCSHGPREYVIAVDGSVVDDGLSVGWTYSEDVVAAAVVEQIATRCMATLDATIAGVRIV